MIPAEAVEAAARGLAAQGWGGWDAVPNELRRAFLRDAKIALEAAAPHMLSHEREQTRMAHIDAYVNRDTADALQEAIDAALSIHAEGGGHCDQCGTTYPCSTVKALTTDAR